MVGGPGRTTTWGESCAETGEGQRDGCPITLHEVLKDEGICHVLNILCKQAGLALCRSIYPVFMWELKPGKPGTCVQCLAMGKHQHVHTKSFLPSSELWPLGHLYHICGSRPQHHLQLQDQAVAAPCCHMPKCIRCKEGNIGPDATSMPLSSKWEEGSSRAEGGSSLCQLPVPE